MGCMDNRMKTPEGELDLRRHEDYLDWKRLQARKAIETLTVVSRNGCLNSEAWSDMTSTLRIKTKHDRHPGYIERYYEGFKDGQTEYSARLLKVLAVLLCWERGNGKARLIFELYDLDYSLSLPRETVRDMLMDFLRVAIDLQAPLVTLEEAKEYLKWLSAWKNHFIEESLTQLMTTQTVISRANFEEKLSKEPLKSYFSAGSLRLAVYSSLKSSQQTH